MMIEDNNHDIPYVSDELMEQIDRIFAHGPRRAKSHDLRFGQFLLNEVGRKYDCDSREHAARILFNLENPEILEIIKHYND